VIVIREGTLETTKQGKWAGRTRAPVIFSAYKERNGWHNVRHDLLSIPCFHSKNIRKRKAPGQSGDQGWEDRLFGDAFA